MAWVKAYPVLSVYTAVWLLVLLIWPTWNSFKCLNYKTFKNIFTKLQIRKHSSLDYMFNVCFFFVKVMVSLILIAFIKVTFTPTFSWS